VSELTLKLCGKPNCDPQEQVRGKMTPEDHHMQYRRAEAAENLMHEHGVYLDLADFWADAQDVEDLGIENANDVRISCAHCGRATPWDRVDIEKFERRGDGDTRRVTVERDGNLDKTYKRWNDMIAADIAKKK
jgi:hypothetical protein